MIKRKWHGKATVMPLLTCLYFVRNDACVVEMTAAGVIRYFSRKLNGHI